MRDAVDATSRVSASEDMSAPSRRTSATTPGTTSPNAVTVRSSWSPPGTAVANSCSAVATSGFERTPASALSGPASAVSPSEPSPVAAVSSNSCSSARGSAVANVEAPENAPVSGCNSLSGAAMLPARPLAWPTTPVTAEPIAPNPPCPSPWPIRPSAPSSSEAPAGAMPETV